MSKNVLLKTKVIGVGAAGNKAAITLLEKGIIDSDDVLLINSSIRDVPEKYHSNLISFGGTHGCGKERNLAQKMIGVAIRNNQAFLEGYLKDRPQSVIIVTSVEGGTGSGASITLGQYISKVLKLNVHMFAFTGFEDDVRGLKNTVDWFKELSNDWIVEAISNKKFLSDGVTKRQAEVLANEEFAKRMEILFGGQIQPSSANMDERDLYKVATQPGFMTIEHVNFGKLTSKEAFISGLKDIITNSKSVPTVASALLMGVIVNVQAKAQTFVNEQFDQIKEDYGTPYELFYHNQSTYDNDYLDVIISGLKIPIDYVKETYEKYSNQLAEVDSRKDSFFNQEAFKIFDTENASQFDKSDSNDAIGSDFLQAGNVAQSAKADNKYEINRDDENEFFKSLGIPEKKDSREDFLKAATVKREL